MWIVLAAALCAAAQTAPVYTAESIVNAPNYTAGPFAPNSVLTLFGSGLCFSTHALSGDDISANTLPDEMGNCRVLVDGLFVPLLYVSPDQVNFIVPSDQIAGDVKVKVFRQGTYGPEATVTLVNAAPALFETDEGFALATHSDYTLVTSESPAQPGEIVVIYATGLGKTVPSFSPAAIPQTMAQLQYLSDLKVRLDGSEVEASRIKYAGVTPGSAGLYQLNVELPDQMSANPELVVAIGSQSSRAGLRLAVQ